MIFKACIQGISTRRSIRDTSNPDFPGDHGRRIPVTSDFDVSYNGSLEAVLPEGHVSGIDFALSLNGIVWAIGERETHPLFTIDRDEQGSASPFRISIEPWPGDEHA